MNEGFKNKYRAAQNWSNQAPPQASPKAAPKATQSIHKKQAAPEAARRWLEMTTRKSDVCEAAATKRTDNFTNNPFVKGVSCGDATLPTNEYGYGKGMRSPDIRKNTACV